MSQVLIQEYLNQLQDARKFSGSTREGVVSDAFRDLLKAWGKSEDLKFVSQYEIETPAKEKRYVDGALVHALRVPFGYWEAKDEKDDLDAEIAHKFKRGYPQDNIIFEDSKEAVLIRQGKTAMRCSVEDKAELERLLKAFFSFERPEIADFRKAVEQFKADIPAVLKGLREMIEAELEANKSFRAAAKKFLLHAQEAINPSLTDADVREMLIQHVLTEEIFSKVFGEDDFHRQNNVAKELYALEGTFFTGDVKKKTLKGLSPYYSAIRSAADRISSHSEKQAFLKVIYENFYKVYNPKAADRLGVVYTPNEIVRFMIDGADWLCERHWKKNLVDKDVEILDPAAGTGTFICELLEHFRGEPRKLRYKYEQELHANEVAILPYYVANLNIEATYAAITGQYLEYPNLCFVDTLDNVAGLRVHAGGQQLLPGGISAENVERIDRQNKRKISVIIGNPPYNANQLNENENNKNRTYPNIDARIKETYIKESTAQKTKLYDMYARFFRWASDRLGEDGVLAFITNRSFIDSRTFDGFRKVVAEEFNEIWIVDLGGDVRANPKISGTKNNVFGIQTGVAISFLVKKDKKSGCRILYARRPELETREDKLAFLGNAKLRSIPTEEIRPNKNNAWLELGEADFERLLPIISRQAKVSKKGDVPGCIFSLYSNGVNTARDSWLYNASKEALEEIVAYLVTVYKQSVRTGNLEESIKWSASLKARLRQGQTESFKPEKICLSLYRPFSKQWLYQSELFVERLGEAQSIYPPNSHVAIPSICLLVGGRQDFCSIATNTVPNFSLFSADVTHYLPLHRADSGAGSGDNITSWALEQFHDRYHPKGVKPSRFITREDIFHYVYGVLHDPVYREKYALNLKREFPRIPFYADFWQWADWGQELMNLHIGYESVQPFPLTRTDVPDEKARKAEQSPKPMLKADKAHGFITLDSETTLAGVPKEAWEYKLGNRCALEWILDQHKEKKPKDPTIREKFNTYRFAGYKEKVVDLLLRVTTVSVRTVAITQAMKKAEH